MFTFISRRLLLDVGENGNKEYISHLAQVLQQNDTSIKKIVISHWHHDHIGGLGDVLKCSVKGIHSLANILLFFFFLYRIICTYVYSSLRTNSFSFYG